MCTTYICTVFVPFDTLNLIFFLGKIILDGFQHGKKKHYCQQIEDCFNVP